METSTPDLIRRVADEAEIRNVIAGLAHLADADSDDFEAYLSLWADDATTIHPEDQAHGHAEILERSRDLRRRRIQGPGTNTVHVNTTQWVRLDSSDVATSESYWQFYGSMNERPPKLLAMGLYRDTLHRTPSGWKVYRREVLSR
jgi:ketosteroid isomerase-like protein